MLAWDHFYQLKQDQNHDEIYGMPERRFRDATRFVPNEELAEAIRKFLDEHQYRLAYKIHFAVKIEYIEQIKAAIVKAIETNPDFKKSLYAAKARNASKIFECDAKMGIPNIVLYAVLEEGAAQILLDECLKIANTLPQDCWNGIIPKYNKSIEDQCPVFYAGGDRTWKYEYWEPMLKLGLGGDSEFEYTEKDRQEILEQFDAMFERDLTLFRGQKPLIMKDPTLLQDQKQLIVATKKKRTRRRRGNARCQ